MLSIQALMYLGVKVLRREEVDMETPRIRKEAITRCVIL